MGRPKEAWVKYVITNMPYNALRKGRYSEANRAYFVTTVVCDRRPVFSDIGVARILVQEMQQLQEEGAMNSLAWVIMPDHLHWLFQLADDINLAKAMGLLKGRSGRSINRHLGERGAFWQTAFHDHAIRGDEDLREIARYIVANPLRTGLVSSLADYPLWDAVWL